MVDCTNGHKRREGNAVRSCELVRQDDTLCTLFTVFASLNCIRSFIADSFQCRQHAINTTADRESSVNSDCLELGRSVWLLVFVVLEGCHLFQRQDGVTDNKPFTVFSTWVCQQVALRSDGTDQTHDNFFTDRVDGRVRNLSEKLLEVVIDLARIVRQNSQSRVVTHTAQRFFSSYSHRKEQHFELFATVTEHVQLPVRQVEVHRVATGPTFFRPCGKVDHSLSSPFTVRA
mmetsp:Transcript_15213/g.37540  ORF Transcript_15213/g.37540 Transcript_15213/m.37540 type:complete len:231 (+) Transcript_15213:2857-3549(+)